MLVIFFFLLQQDTADRPGANPVFSKKSPICSFSVNHDLYKDNNKNEYYRIAGPLLKELFKFKKTNKAGMTILSRSVNETQGRIDFGVLWNSSVSSHKIKTF